MYRLNSITVKSINYIIITSLKDNNENETPLTIEQKEKLTQMLDGIMNVFTFVWKSINEKFIEIMETK